MGKKRNLPLTGFLYLPVIMSLSFPIFILLSASFRGFGIRITTKYVKSIFTDKQFNISIIYKYKNKL